jgi:hypothetical protein
LATVECILAAMDMNLLPSAKSPTPYIEDVRAIWSSVVDWCLGIHQQRRRHHSRPFDARSTNNWVKSEHCPTDIRYYLKAFGLCRPFATEREIELPIVYGNKRAELPPLPQGAASDDSLERTEHIVV